MMKTLTIACGVLATCASSAGGQTGTLPVQIDFAKPIGRLKALHSVNGGPRTVGRHSGDMVTLHQEAGFPSVRLHDYNWPHPDVVDVPTIFHPARSCWCNCSPYQGQNGKRGETDSKFSSDTQ